MNAHGRRTLPGRCAAHWSRGRPTWLQGGWRNRLGQPTFPLERGGWSNGPGDHPRSYRGVTFAPGSSLPLHPYRTLAVDPRLIPRGSRVYIPAYRPISGGWFVAQDTGGAIIGHHVGRARRSDYLAIWTATLTFTGEGATTGRSRGIAPRVYALLETTGRRTGRPRRTPVGNGLVAGSDTFWLISEHGTRAGYVRNIEADPRVRVNVGRRWRAGVGRRFGG